MAIGGSVVVADVAAHAPAPALGMRCLVTSACPAAWASYLDRCGAGFFHTPPGNDVGSRPGEPLYIRILAGTEVVGIAAGVRRPCRLSDTPRHVLFPTYPAV